VHAALSMTRAQHRERCKTTVELEAAVDAQTTSSGIASSVATRRPSPVSGGCTTRRSCGTSGTTAWRCCSTLRRRRSIERCAIARHITNAASLFSCLCSAADDVLPAPFLPSLGRSLLWLCIVSCLPAGMLVPQVLATPVQIGTDHEWTCVRRDGTTSSSSAD